MSGDAPTEKGLDGYMMGAGQRSLEDALPDLALVAGAFNLNARWGVIERMRKNVKDVTHIWQLPVAIDRNYVRSAKPELLRRASPVERMVWNSDFEPGVLKIVCSGGVWSPEFIPISFFTKRRSRQAVTDQSTDYMYVAVEGDNHSGSSAKLWLDDPRTGRHVPLEVAFSEIMMRSFTEKGRQLPIVVCANVGDNLQGHHFPTQQNRHPRLRGYAEAEINILKRIDSARNSNDPSRLKEVLASLGDISLEQFRLHGEHWPMTQLEDFYRLSIERRLDFFAEVLKRNQRAGVKIRGIEEVLSGEKGAEDGRDIGVINWVGGNHFERTVLGELSEGPLYRNYLAALLSGHKSIKFSMDELRKMVRAPLYGNLPVGYGLISAQGGYEWGLHMRHDLTKNSGQNADRLSKVMRNAAQRGDYPEIFTGRYWIWLNGDVHFYNAAFGRSKMIIICGTGTEGDSFGDMTGFRKSNAGTVVVGIPVDGPDSGPIRIIPFPHNFLSAYLKKPWKIDWEKVFPNAI
jgi:hypothetical protein